MEDVFSRRLGLLPISSYTFAYIFLIFHFRKIINLLALFTLLAFFEHIYNLYRYGIIELCQIE